MQRSTPKRPGASTILDERTLAEGAVTDISEEVLDQAVLWLVTLQSGVASAAEQEACRQWRQSDSEHERAWQRLSALRDSVREARSGLPAPLARQTLQRAAMPSRRFVLKSLAGLAVIGGGAYLAQQRLAGHGWSGADYTAAIGGRLGVQLEDGGRVLLNSGSAIDVDQHLGRIALRQGEMLVDALHLSGGIPLEISLDFGLLRVEAGRLAIGFGRPGQTESQRHKSAELAVLDGSVEVVTPGEQRRIEVGTQVRLDHSGLGPTSMLQAATTAWTDGMLLAERMRLDEVIIELDRYRRGLLSCDPKVAALLVSGAFPLNNIDAALAALTQVLPVRIRYRSRYWVSVLPA